jgi:hypothetical protein
MKNLIFINFLFCSLLLNAQIKKRYIVILDTIQHINWPKDQTIEQAQRANTIEYPNYWTDHIVWEYDLFKNTAIWKGGPNTKVYKIYNGTNYNDILTLTIGDENQIGWTVQIKIQQNGATLFTSSNLELVDGKADGYFSRNVTFKEINNNNE